MKILPLEHIRDDLEAARVWVLLHMFYLDLDNALRKGELAALRLDDVDIQGRTIPVS